MIVHFVYALYKITIKLKKETFEFPYAMYNVRYQQPVTHVYFSILFIFKMCVNFVFS